MSVFYSVPAVDTDIDDVAKRYSISIDPEYRQFLKKYNGIFVAGEDYVDLDFDKVENSLISFQALFGLHSTNGNFNLLNVNNDYADELSSIDSKLIIGDDPGGNYYVIGLDDSDVQCVYYWDRTHLHSFQNRAPDIREKNEEGDLYIVANSFFDFWDILYGHIRNMSFVKQDNWPDS